MANARYLVGDVFDALATLEDNSVDLIMSSPPFLALRSYLPADHINKHREIGSEATPADFLDTLLDVVEACDRVLAPHGSLCFELGDTYAGSGGAGGDYNEGGLRDGQPKASGSQSRSRTGWHRPPTNPDHPRTSDWRKEVAEDSGTPHGGNGWPLPKSLCGLPTLFAWSLAYGRNLLRPERTTPRWRIRNVVVWARPNPPVGCVDLETEALTPDGWFTIDQLRDGDLIAAYDPKTDSCRFLPSQFYRYHHEGEMVAIDKRSTSQRLTPDHRAWTRTRKRGPHVRLADDLTNDCDTMLAAPFDDVAGPAPVTVERAALLGWFVAEGSPHSRQSRIIQSLTANPQKVDRIRELLERDGADFRESIYRHPGGSDVVTFHVKGELAEWLNLHHKRLPMNYVTTWPEAQCQALFDALIDGDGHRRKTGRGHGILFHQKDEPIADAVQVMALRLGYRATKSYQESMRLWQITIGKNRWTAVRKWDGVGIPREPHSGDVWCPQIETTFWLARRKGKTFVTGNSLGDKFRPATSYLTVACKSDKRWFDLDAVREPGASFDRKQGGPNGSVKAAEQTAKAAKRSDVTGSGREDVRYIMAPGGAPAPLVNHPAGAPPLDYWEIPTQPYAGSHYATFPDKLVVRPVKAMCPASVCRTCGEPRRRITEKSEAYAREREQNPDHWTDTEHGAHAVFPSGPSGFCASYDTLGWSDCGHDDYRAGVTLDPFAGSGTTLAVATGHGRDAVGIDIDERNATLALERVGPLFMSVERLNSAVPLGPEAVAQYSVDDAGTLVLPHGSASGQAERGPSLAVPSSRSLAVEQSSESKKPFVPHVVDVETEAV